MGSRTERDRFLSSSGLKGFFCQILLVDWRGFGNGAWGFKENGIGAERAEQRFIDWEYTSPRKT